MAERIRAHDWGATPIGALETWPDPLIAAANIALHATFPTAIYWGRDLTLLYNDAWSPIPAEKHPWSLGRTAKEVWPDIWDVIEPQFMRVFETGEGFSAYDQLLLMERGGKRHETYWTYSFTPILGPSGEVLGIFNQGNETTANVRGLADRAAETTRLKELFQQAPAAVAVLRGPQHVFELANPTYLELVGRPDIVGKPVAEALPETAQQGFVTLLDEVYRTGVPHVGHATPVQLRRNGGMETFQLDFVYQPIRDEKGRIDGIFVEATDVTDRARAVDALRDSEERFRLVAESAPVMLWMGDANGKCVYLNGPQRAFWGVAEEDLAAFNWNDTVHPEDRDALFAPFGEAMRTQSALKVEARYRRASDGAWRLLHTDARPRFDASGAFLGMIGVNVDVTDTREAVAALENEKRRLEVLNATGALVAAELDLDVIVQSVTDAGVALTGAQFGAFFYNVIDDSGGSYMLYALSGAPREAFDNFPMPRATAIFEPTFLGKGVVRSDNVREDARYGLSGPHHGMPKGHLPVTSYLAVPVTSRTGEVLGGLFFGHVEAGVFKPEHEALLSGVAGQAATAIDNARLFRSAQREIEERRRAEAALQALNATLEERVVEEVAQRAVAEEQLRHAQKMEAIGKLTGGIAHDFNNMMAVVIGGLNLLQRRIARGETDVARYVEAAMDGATRASALTQRLLAFSRQQPLAPEPIDANRLVGSMTEMLTRTLGEQIRVETVLLAGLWRTYADPLQLESAILNLSVNARDAMPDGGKLTIETANAYVDERYAREFEIPEGQYVMICVTDTGTGMTPEVAAQAFDPFFTTKGVGQGTGLGLSQVFGFVRQSGGHVKIYSEPGHGTTLKIYLPRHYGAEATAAAKREAVGLPRGSADEIVLVVEDEERVRNYSIEALREFGYTVVAAANGAEALRLIEEGQPVTLLFTDIVMPGMTGAQLAVAARKKLPSLKVLFTTGYTRNAIVHNGVLDPGTQLLAKPFGLEQLASKVRDVLDREFA